MCSIGGTMISGSISSEFAEATLVGFLEVILEHGERALIFVKVAPSVAVCDEQLFLFKHSKSEMNGSCV